MDPSKSMWQVATVDRFSQLYACISSGLEPLLGAETTLNIIAQGTEALHGDYPFLGQLEWHAEGIDAESLAAAIDSEEKAHAQAGCERLLQEIQLLVETCGGPVLARCLQIETERVRRALAPSASLPEAEDGVGLTGLDATLPVLQSMGQQAWQLHCQLQEQGLAFEQMREELEALRAEATGASLPLSMRDNPTDPVTEQARAESFYYDLFDLSPDGVVVTDHEGFIIQANLQGAEILEFETPAELIGRKTSEFFISPEPPPSFMDRLSQPQHIQRQRHEVRTSQGRMIVIVSSSRMIEYEGRQCFLWVLRDVTERAHLRQEMEDFAYSASHDLQAPLRTFEGYARWLLEDYGEALDDMGRQLCEEIIDDALHMKKLLDGLLEYSRVGRLHTESAAVDVMPILNWVQHDLQIEIGKSEATITLPETLPTVLYSEVRLTQIFSNLISNALKFSQAGHAPKIAVTCEELPRHYRFSVSDNGIGIAPEHYDRIFEIFKRLHTREDYPGTGAGLTIVKKIVESRGGQIGLDSILGEGSTFWFTIPKTQKSPRADESSC